MVARTDLCAGLSHPAAGEPAGERISALANRQLLAARAVPEGAERGVARSRRGPGAIRAWQAVESAPPRAALLRPSLRAVQGLHGVLWSAIRRLPAGRIRRRIPLRARRDAAREAALGTPNDTRATFGSVPAAAAHQMLDGFEEAVLGETVHGEDAADDLGRPVPGDGRFRIQPGGVEEMLGEVGEPGDAGRAGVLPEAP